jgi:polyphosphate kinase
LPQLVERSRAARAERSAPARKFVWIEDVIAANLESLFPGLEIVESHPFHVTRDAEVAIKELESDDLLETVEEAVWRRRFRKPVRLQTDSAHFRPRAGNSGGESGRGPGRRVPVRGRSIWRGCGSCRMLDRPELCDEPFEPWTPEVFSSQLG